MVSRMSALPVVSSTVSTSSWRASSAASSVRFAGTQSISTYATHCSARCTMPGAIVTHAIPARLMRSQRLAAVTPLIPRALPTLIHGARGET